MGVRTLQQLDPTLLIVLVLVLFLTTGGLVPTATTPRRGII